MYTAVAAALMGTVGPSEAAAQVGRPPDQAVTGAPIDNAGDPLDGATSELPGIDQPAQPPVSGPDQGGADPGTDPGTGPGTGPGDPGTDPGTGPGTDPGDPGTGPGDPGTDPGTAPGTDPGTGPGTDPGDPGTDPADPGTDPADPGTDPGTVPGGPTQGSAGDGSAEETSGKGEPSLIPALPLPTLMAPLAQVPPVAVPNRARSRGDARRRAGGQGDGGGTGGASGGGQPAADAGAVAATSGAGATGPAAGATTPPGTDGTGANGTAGTGERGGDGSSGSGSDGGSPVTRTVTRTVRDIVKVVPDSAKIALALLVALAAVLGAGYFLSTARARRLARQRRDLLQEVGLLQGALLPAVPATLGSLRTSVAYRPAEGPGAGGDFYDVLPLTGGRVGFILGDVSGHGRAALARTAFMRYTLRAYLEAGLEPRMALQVAGRVIDDNLGGDFATVLIAVHDPSSSSLTFASAGHPAPIIVGHEHYEPVTTASSPPIGVGIRTGLRQTTVPLEPGSVACFFTDGLIEARTADGVLGRQRLEELVAQLGRDADAEQLLASIAAEARILSDDMATCIITPTTGVTAGGFRTEQLELSASDLESPLAARFLESCGIPAAEAERALREAHGAARHFGGVVMHVVLGNRQHVEVLPRNVESIEAASRRAAAAR